MRAKNFFVGDYLFWGEGIYPPSKLFDGGKF